MTRFIASSVLAALSEAPGLPRGVARFTSALAALMLLASAARAGEPIARIAFGSCARQDRPQLIWDAIRKDRPDVLVLLGDNIYGDTEDMQTLRDKYAQFAAVPEFAALRNECRLLATWDDHDYGANDAGAEFSKRAESQQVMLDFLGVATDSPRRRREGVYHAQVFGPQGRRVQVILLDTRYFRSPLRKGEPGREGDGRLGRYVPNDDPEATVLGEAQWAWLHEQLQQPAELRVIASSIQVIAEDHRFEKWANFPRERERLFKLIAETRAAGVVFISGDRHMAELSRMDAGAGYALYDVTSSALNQTSQWYNEINRHRWSRSYFEPNYGLISIDWSAADPLVTLEVRKEDGGVAILCELKLSELGAP